MATEGYPLSSGTMVVGSGAPEKFFDFDLRNVELLNSFELQLLQPKSSAGVSGKRRKKLRPRGRMHDAVVR